MTDADAQSGKVGAAELGENVAQSVVTTVTTTALEAHRPRRQVDLIVGDEDLFGFQSVKVRQSRHRAAAVVHIGHGFQQP